MTAPYSAGRETNGVESSLRLPVDPAAVATARAWVVGLCRRWNVDGLCDDAALVVSELVGNAILHAGTGVLVEVNIAGSAIVVVVTDRSSRPVRSRTAGLWDEGGRGLLLVDALSTRWGVTACPTGKRVWAELQTPQQPGARAASRAGEGIRGRDG